VEYKFIYYYHYHMIIRRRRIEKCTIKRNNKLYSANIARTYQMTAHFCAKWRHDCHLESV